MKHVWLSTSRNKYEDDICEKKTKGARRALIAAGLIFAFCVALVMMLPGLADEPENSGGLEGQTQTGTYIGSENETTMGDTDAPSSAAPPGDEGGATATVSGLTPEPAPATVSGLTPEPAATGGQFGGFAPAGGILFAPANIIIPDTPTTSADLSRFIPVNGVTITDSAGNPVSEFFIGTDYKFNITFMETDGLQFANAYDDSVEPYVYYMFYDLPAGLFVPEDLLDSDFSIYGDPDGPGDAFADNTLLGIYTITYSDDNTTDNEPGKYTVKFYFNDFPNPNNNNEPENLVDCYANVQIFLELKAQFSKVGEDQQIHFGDQITQTVDVGGAPEVNHKVSVTKTVIGSYNATKKNMPYLITIKADEGDATGITLSDTLGVAVGNSSPDRIANDPGSDFEEGLKENAFAVEEWNGTTYIRTLGTEEYSYAYDPQTMAFSLDFGDYILREGHELRIKYTADMRPAIDLLNKYDYNTPITNTVDVNTKDADPEPVAQVQWITMFFVTKDAEPYGTDGEASWKWWSVGDWNTDLNGAKITDQLSSGMVFSSSAKVTGKIGYFADGSATETIVTLPAEWITMTPAPGPYTGFTIEIPEDYPYQVVRVYIDDGYRTKVADMSVFDSSAKVDFYNTITANLPNGDKPNYTKKVTISRPTIKGVTLAKDGVIVMPENVSPVEQETYPDGYIEWTITYRIPATLYHKPVWITDLIDYSNSAPAFMADDVYSVMYSNSETGGAPARYENYEDKDGIVYNYKFIQPWDHGFPENMFLSLKEIAADDSGADQDRDKYIGDPVTGSLSPFSVDTDLILVLRTPLNRNIKDSTTQTVKDYLLQGNSIVNTGTGQYMYYPDTTGSVSDSAAVSLNLKNSIKKSGKLVTVLEDGVYKDYIEYRIDYTIPGRLKGYPVWIQDSNLEMTLPGAPYKSVENYPSIVSVQYKAAGSADSTLLPYADYGSQTYNNYRVYKDATLDTYNHRYRIDASWFLSLRNDVATNYDLTGASAEKSEIIDPNTGSLSPFGEDTTLVVTYRISLDAKVLNSDGSPAVPAVTLGEGLAQTIKDSSSKGYSYNAATGGYAVAEKVQELTATASVFNPIKKTAMPNADGTQVTYTIEVAAGWLLGHDFTDTFDSRLEYVPNSFRTYDMSDGGQAGPYKKDGADIIDLINEGKSGMLEVGENTTTIKLTAQQMKDTVYVTIDSNWYGNNKIGGLVNYIDDARIFDSSLYKSTDSYYIVYTLKIRDGVEGRFDVNNTAALGGMSASATASVGKQIVYKSMTAVNNMVTVSIDINKAGAKLLFDAPLTVIDTMDSRLELAVSTLKLYEYKMAGDAATKVRELDPGEWSYVLDAANKFTLKVPSDMFVRIEYQALIMGNLNDQGAVSNTVVVDGFDQDKADTAFKISAVSAGMLFGSKDLTVLKRGSEEGNPPLAGAAFSVYMCLESGIVYADYESKMKQIAISKGIEPMIEIDGKNFYYICNSATTAEDGNLLIKSQWLMANQNAPRVYALVENLVPALREIQGDGVTLFSYDQPSDWWDGFTGRDITQTGLGIVTVFNDLLPATYTAVITGNKAVTGIDPAEEDAKAKFTFKLERVIETSQGIWAPDEVNKYSDEAFTYGEGVFNFVLSTENGGLIKDGNELAPGDYYYRITEVPDAGANWMYETRAYLVKVSVSGAGEIFVSNNGWIAGSGLERSAIIPPPEFVNTYGGPKLPDTGGMGTWLFTLTGLMLLSAVAAVHIMTRKRKYRNKA